MNLNEKKQSPFSSPAIMMIVALICCALWGSATPAIKIGYSLLSVEGVASIMLFAGIRFFLAGILTVIIFSVTGRRVLLPKKENITRILIVGLFQTVIQYVFFYLGLAYTSGVKGTVTSGSSAFISVLIASLIFHQEKLSLKKILACVLGFLGIVIMNFDGLFVAEDMLDIMGVGFVLLSTVSASLASVLTKKFSAYESPVVISGYQFMAGGLFMIIVGFSFGGRIYPSGIMGILDLVYLALVSALAYSLWSILLKYNPVSRVTVFNFTTPIFGVILTFIFLSEEPSRVTLPILIVALVLISAGILLLNYRRGGESESEQKIKEE